MADVAVEVSIPFEEEESERFETFLENIKYELRGQIQMFQMSLKNGSCAPERFGRIIELCENVREIVEECTSDLLQTSIVKEHPSLIKVSQLLRADINKRDSGISSEPGLFSRNGSAKTSTNRLLDQDFNDHNNTSSSLSPSNSLADINKLKDETNNPVSKVQADPTVKHVTRETRFSLSSGPNSPVPSRRSRNSILSSASAYVFTATDVAEFYRLRLTTENNQCLQFRLVPLTSSSSDTKLKDLSSANRLSGMSHVSSNDSVLGMIEEDVNGHHKDADTEQCMLNDLSKKFSESSEEDNTKQRLLSSVSDTTLCPGVGAIANIQLVRKL